MSTAKGRERRWRLFSTFPLVVWYPGRVGLLDMKAVVLSNDTLKVQFDFDNPKDCRMAYATLVEKPQFVIGTLDAFGERTFFNLPIHKKHPNPR